MDPVRAADGRRQLVRQCLLLQGGEQRIEVRDQNVAGAGELDRQRGVEHIRGRHALMGKARLRPDDLCKVRQEGDDIMLCLALDLINAGDVECRSRAFLPQDTRGLLGHDPRSASASVACASISNQIRKRVSADQMAVISGRA